MLSPRAVQNLNLGLVGTARIEPLILESARVS
jgi:hypothetical protein